MDLQARHSRTWAGRLCSCVVGRLLALAWRPLACAVVTFQSPHGTGEHQLRASSASRVEWLLVWYRSHIFYLSHGLDGVVGCVPSCPCSSPPSSTRASSRSRARPTTRTYRPSVQSITCSIDAWCVVYTWAWEWCVVVSFVQPPHINIRQRR